MDKAEKIRLLLALLDDKEEQEESSFYVPSATPNWYYDGEGLREMHRVDPLVFRKLLGI